MATDPFTSALALRLEDRVQAYRFNCIVGEVVAFKFFCCQGPPVLGVTKAPVAVLDVDPDSQCLGQAITADGSGSYVYPGFGFNRYRVYWGDGTDTGWIAGAPAPQNHVYLTAGIFTVRLVVEDTQAPNVQGTTEATVEIVDCANDAVLIRQMYALSATTGPWVKDVAAGGAPPPWTQRIAGLSLPVVGRDLKLDPHRKHLSYGQRHVWIATQGGPAKSADDMAGWARLYASLPEPQDADGLGEVKANLDWFTVGFNPLVRDTVFVLAGTATRAWVYWTTDGGATWQSWQVRR